MPLGNGAARVSQHVGPMLQTEASRLAAHKDLSDGVILTDLVIIKHCDGHQDFLRRDNVSVNESSKHQNMYANYSESLL